MTEVEKELSDQIRRHECWWRTRDDNGPDLADWRVIGEILGMLHVPGRKESFGSSIASGWLWWASRWPEDGAEAHHGATPGEAVARALLAQWRGE